MESILSLSGVCKFTTNFRNWKKKIRDVKKCKKRKKRVQWKRNAQMTRTMWMEWVTQHLSRNACADDVTLTRLNERDCARYAHVDVGGSGQWCTHRAVPRIP